MPEWLVWPGLALLGAAVGIYGTMIGAGGGFVLVPLLIFAYPDLPPASITALSLGVVFFNAVSGSQAYARQHRIDYVAGGLFAIAAIPGAVVGVLATTQLESQSFELAFAVLLLVAAFWIMLPTPGRMRVSPPSPRRVPRMLTVASGETYAYSFHPWLGLAMALVTGLVASVFGVGGGIFFVPGMILVLRIPSLIATATSTFVLMFTGGAGALVHLLAGDYAGLAAEEVSLTLGVVAGAQLGALISGKLAEHQAVFARLFSGALVIVALRLLASVVL